MWGIFRRSFSSTGSFMHSRKVRVRGKKLVGMDEEVDLSKYQKMKVSNPGVDRRLAALRDDKVKIHDINNMDDNEADFFRFDECYDDYKKDEAAHKEFVKMKIVGRKYFSENIPNYLTWSEKEIVRDLHQADPEHWTPEKIAESFPVSPQNVTKLLKNTWKPASQLRIDRHDASALRNWKELKEGEVDGIDPELRKHILKFSNRTIPSRQQFLNNIDNKKIDITPSGKPIGEYASIVTKYDKVMKKTELQNDEVIRNTSKNENKTNSNNTHNIIPNPGVANKRKNVTVTLEALRQQINKESKISDTNVSPVDKLILSPTLSQQVDAETLSNNSKGDMTNNNNNKNDIEEVTNVSSQIQNSRAITPRDTQLAYPNRIRIPKNSLKIGATYKVKDCYYDWDGRFLYRVPGME